MSLGGNRSRLMAATKQISLQWEETTAYWRDARSQEFGEKYMVPLRLHVDRALAICEKLEQILAKARSDCE